MLSARPAAPEVPVKDRLQVCRADGSRHSCREKWEADAGQLPREIAVNKKAGHVGWTGWMPTYRVFL